MLKGYNGKILLVDLSTSIISEEIVKEETYRKFIGGQGLGVRILYEKMKVGADPIGPDNILGFVTGLLTGSGLHGARFTVVSKSPISGGWGDSNCGGSFAHELKAAGFDGIFISGISAKPVYLFLREGKAELKDANYLWGKDTVDTDESIKNELGDNKIRVACIGPIGEAKLRSAAIMHEGSAAARGGLGAVMGSKLLKAVAVRGTQKLKINAPELFSQLRKDYLSGVKVSENPWVPFFKNWGTPAFFEGYLTAGDTPIKNWTLFGEEGFPNWAKLHGDSITKYQTKKRACKGCPLACKGSLKIDKGPYPLERTDKVEYETLGMLGSNLLVDNIEAVIKANDICNRFGIDTIAVGSSLGLAMECYDRGLISKKDTDGIDLVWGDADAMVKMVEKIVKRDGFGAVLAEGSKIAAQHIGKGSDKFAVHVGGQDLPAHDARTSVGHGWGYIVDPTPGRHTATTFKDSQEEGQEWYEGLKYGLSDDLNFSKIDKLDTEANAEIFAICSDADRLWTSAGLCWFALYPEGLPLVDAIKAITGWNFTLAEGLKTGRRIQTLRQAFNIREGVKTHEWRIPDRMDIAPTTGPIKGRKIDFKKMKKIGYKSLGWDSDSGVPLKSTLEDLELLELVGDFDN
ncbi:aldehyde ferredoxin oxidoreductase family protein [Thermodesulfobacteriota bacterium]